MKQMNKKKKSLGVRWKIFGYMLIPTLLLIVILWIAQTVLLGVFYAGIKTNELEKTTDTVINNIEQSDIRDRIFFLSGNGNINIRVIDTSEFQNLYSSGEDFDSVTHGWGAYGMWQLYEEAKKNGGEYVRYYSRESRFENEQSDTEQMPEAFYEAPDSHGELHRFGENFERVPRPALFDNIVNQNDLLYAKIAELSDGSEIMVVADTRLSPLDSTVATLRMQLVFSTVVTVIISLIISFLIAKRISRPIEKINTSAKSLAEGAFDTTFDGRGFREIEELSDTLNFAAKELGKVEKLRQELLANVSHDMRTPLTMIVGYSEIMRDIPGENNPENVQVIIDEANRLSAFVTNVLDLSKLQSGMEHLESERINITEQLRRAAERYSKMLSDKGVCVELFCDEDVFTVCDGTKITQVLFNLIDNAINYSNDPKRIRICQRITEKDCVRIEISDNGNGINPEELPYIWDRYYKSDSSHKRNMVGSGLGLSIVKQILMMHSARYGVETTVGKGSTFWFELKISKE